MTVLVRVNPFLAQCQCGWTDTADVGVIKLDPYLSPFQDALKRRSAKAQEWIRKLAELEGGVEKFSRVSSLVAPCSQSIH